MLNGPNYKEILQYFRSPDSFSFERLLPNVLIFLVLLDMIKLQWNYVVAQGLPPES